MIQYYCLFCSKPLLGLSNVEGSSEFCFWICPACCSSTDCSACAKKEKEILNRG